MAHAVASGDRCIGLAGRTGVGKSAVLAAFAAAPPPGVEVWDVDLAGAPAGEGVLAEAARRLGLTLGRATVGNGVDAIAARVQDLRVVLALDHLDALRIEADDVAALLAACPRLTLMLVAVRPPVPTDAVITIRPLSVPAEGAGLYEIAQSPSVRLFIHHAARADPRFRFDHSTENEVAEVCRLVGGLPLAIELVAARVGMLPVTWLARELRGEKENIALDLVTARGTVPALSIRAALASTVGHLRPRERALLGLLAHFVGPFPFAAAVGVGGGAAADVLDDLEMLVDLHLVEPVTTADGDRAFEVLPIVRAFVSDAAAQPEGEGRRRAVIARILSDAVDAEVSTAEPVERRRALTQAQVMRRDLLDEARRLVDEGEPAAVAWLADCAEVLDGFAEQTVAGELLERLFAADRLSGLDDLLRARALVWSAYLLAMSPAGAGLLSVALDRYRRGVALIEAGGWTRLSLRATFLGLMIFTVAGDLPEASRLAGAGFEEATSRSEQAWVARFEVWLAAAASARGDEEGAVALASAALAHGQRTQDSYAIVGAAVMLHMAPPDAVPDDTPLPPLEEVLALARAAGDVTQEGYVLATLTSVLTRSGQPRQAARWCAERLAQGNRRGWSLSAEISLAQATMIASDLGEHRVAGRWLGALRADRERFVWALGRNDIAGLERAEAAVPAHLGAAVAARVIGAGQMLSIGDAVLEALGWMRDVVAEEEAGHEAESVVLTPREAEVLALLATGQTNKEIALRLALSVKTVMHHSMAIYRKLDVRGRAEATAVAYRLGLLAEVEPRERRAL